MHLTERILILSVIFMETSWSATRYCHSYKLSELSLVLRHLGLNDWHIWETSLVQLLIISQTFLTLWSLILSVVPDTNAVSERSASAFRRLKTGIFEQLFSRKKRLNHCMILHEHGRHWKSVCFNIKWQTKSLWKIICQLKLSQTMYGTVAKTNWQLTVNWSFSTKSFQVR